MKINRKQSQNTVTDDKIMIQLDQFSHLYLFPHEFLSLVCNAYPSQNILNEALKLDFKMKKVICKTDGTKQRVIDQKQNSIKKEGKK